MDDVILQGMVERGAYMTGVQGKSMMKLCKDIQLMHYYLLYQGGESSNVELATTALEAAMKELITLNGILDRMYEIKNSSEPVVEAAAAQGAK